MPHRVIALDDSRSKAWLGAGVVVLVLAAVIGVPAFAADPANLKAVAPEALRQPQTGLKVAPPARLPLNLKVLEFSKAGITVTPTGLGTPMQLTPRAPLIPGVAHLKVDGDYDSNGDYFEVREFSVGGRLAVFFKAVQVGKPVLVTFHVDRVARPSSDTVVVRSPGSPSRLSTSVPVGAPKAISFIVTPQSTREFQQVVLSSDFGVVRVASIELTPVR